MPGRPHLWWFATVCRSPCLKNAVLFSQGSSQNVFLVVKGRVETKGTAAQDLRQARGKENDICDNFHRFLLLIAEKQQKEGTLDKFRSCAHQHLVIG